MAICRFASASCSISIHALHEESDPASAPMVPFCAFQSTLSMRRATIGVAQLDIMLDFNPRSP